MEKLVTIVVVLAMVCAVPVASASPYSDAVNALSPVGYWQFEGDYTDSSGNGNTLTPFGTVGITPGPGLPGMGPNALDLRHAGGQQGLYVSMLPGNALNLAGSQYSITAWFSNDEASGAWGILALNRDATWGGAGGANYGISNYLDTDVTTIGWKVWPTWGLGLSGTSAGAKAWHMLVLSVDLLAATDKYKVYIDGALVATGTHSLTSIQGPGDVFIVGNNETPIGSGEWGPSDFNGRMDELAVFGSALSAGQIAGLYTAATTPPEPSPFVAKVLALDPVAYWRFEGNYTDSSGHGNTLTPYDNASITAAGPSGLGSAADLRGDGTRNAYYVDTPSGSSLNFGGTHYSINLWYSNALSANETTTSSILVNKRNGPQWLVDLWDYGMWTADYGAAGDALRGTVGAAYDFDSTPLSSPPISPPISLDEKNVWHMATVTWTKDTGPPWSPNGAACFYLDGKLVGAGPGIGNPGLQQATHRLILGNRASPGDDYQDGGFFKGKLDEVAIFSTALTAEDVADLYGTPIPPPEGLSRGHQILVQRGLQIQAAAHSQAWGYFNTANWAASRFTTYNSDGYALDPTLMPAAPGIPWSRVCADGSFDINSAEIPYVPSLVNYQLKDESDLTDSAELEYQTAATGWFRVKYPNAMTFTSQYGPRYTPAQWQTYMQQVKPDMLLFSVYPFYGQSDGAAGVNELGANLQKYRLLSLAGNDGTSAQPIPYGLWLQTYWRDSPIDPSGYHAVSGSEIRANQFAAWAFGAKFADAYVYDNEGASIRSVLFSGSGQNTPTAQFTQIAETNRQSRNLGPALVRLITTDVRMKLGRTAAGVPSPPVAGVPSWTSGADPYITNITVTNQGTRNNGYEGDVIVGYFKPLDPSFTNPGHADDVYVMIVNGLTYPSGEAVDTRQLIHLDFNFSASGITNLLRLSRLTGLVETVNLTHVSGSLYSLDLSLDGGTGDLFKFNNGGTFVISSEPATLTGQVHLEGFGGAPQDVLVRLELRQGAAVDVRRVTPDAGWGFSLSGITPGIYTITIQTPGWRLAVLADRPISGTTILDPVTLSAGDLGGDGHITSIDLAALLANME